MVNQKTVELIKKWEGCSLKSYKCPSGIWTVGWGHTSDNYFSVLKPVDISPDFAEDLLRHDIEEAENIVKKQASINLNENQYGALVSIAFNSGSFYIKGKAGLVKSELLKALLAADMEKAAALIPCYKIRGGGKVLKGLKNRRLDEYNLFIEPSAVGVNYSRGNA